MPTRDTIQSLRVGYRPLPPDQEAAETARYEVQVAGQPSAGIVARWLDSSGRTTYRTQTGRKIPRWRAITPAGDVLYDRYSSRHAATAKLIGQQRRDALLKHMAGVHLICYDATPHVSMATLLADHRREIERARFHEDKECDYAV